MSSGMRCANHADTETNLRCSRCGKPICPRCVIQTPVGGRCRECANVRKAPMFQVSAGLYARATLCGLVVALVGGYLLAMSGSFFGRMGGLFGVSSILLLGLGYVVGEAVSRGARGRVSTGLTLMAGAFTLVAIVGGRAVVAFTSIPDVLPLGTRVEAALSFGLGGLLGNLLGLLFVGLAVVIATSRVR